MAGTAICEAFLIDFGCFFRFFTSEIISEYFVIHFRFLDGKLKKYILRQGAYPLPTYLSVAIFGLVFFFCTYTTQWSGSSRCFTLSSRFPAELVFLYIIWLKPFVLLSSYLLRLFSWLRFGQCKCSTCKHFLVECYISQEVQAKIFG